MNSNVQSNTYILNSLNISSLYLDTAGKKNSSYNLTVSHRKFLKGKGLLEVNSKSFVKISKSTKIRKPYTFTNLV